MDNKEDKFNKERKKGESLFRYINRIYNDEEFWKFQLEYEEKTKRQSKKIEYIIAAIIISIPIYMWIKVIIKYF